MSRTTETIMAIMKEFGEAEHDFNVTCYGSSEDMGLFQRGLARAYIELKFDSFKVLQFYPDIEISGPAKLSTIDGKKVIPALPDKILGSKVSYVVDVFAKGRPIEVASTIFNPSGTFCEVFTDESRGLDFLNSDVERMTKTLARLGYEVAITPINSISAPMPSDEDDLYRVLDSATNGRTT